MPGVRDVAAYILQRKGPLPPMKLQKLVYYSQAWSLVWDDAPDAPLFQERIEAWANGPVVPELYQAHKGQYPVNGIPDGDAERLNPTQRETIDRVLDYYGDKSPQWLSDLTHMEDPWIEARKRAGLQDGDRGREEIRLGEMELYYGSL